MRRTSQKSPPQNSPEQTCGQRDSRVRIFRSAAVSEGLTEQEADSFLRLLNSSKAKVLKIDPHGLSLKMLRISCPFMEDGTLRPFLIRWPHSATISSTDFSIQRISAPLKTESGSTLSLADILEPEVDQKYFLSQRAVEKLLSNSGISVAMAAQSGGWGGKTGLYFVDLCNGNPKLTSHARCIKTKYNSGITNRGGDNSGVFYGCRAVVTPEREEKKQNGRRIKECGEPAFTLTTQDRHGVFLQDCEKCPYGMHIREATKQGYAVARCGDSVNLALPDSRTRRGRVGKDCTGTLETSCNQGTPFAGCGLIRRLTPRECWRLQGFTDEMFDRARAVNSDNQLYRQAGNSVTIQVVYAVGRQILAAQEALEQGESK